MVYYFIYYFIWYTIYLLYLYNKYIFIIFIYKHFLLGRKCLQEPNNTIYLLLDGESNTNT